MINSIMTTISERAGAFIIDKTEKNCLLVHQKKSNLWGIPKGRKDFLEEEFADCMKREVMEEVGIDLNRTRYDQLGIISVYSKTKIFILRLKDYGMPELTPPLEDGRENHEVDLIEWVPIDEVLERKINSITKRVIDRYSSNYSKKLTLEEQMMEINAILNMVNNKDLKVDSNDRS